jgi:DNA mismatch repair protein MutS2
VTVTTDLQQQKTARELDWPRLLERVAAFCQSGVGAESIRALSPEPSFEAGSARMLRTREAILLQAVAPIPAARIEDQGVALEQVARGSGLDASELRALGITLELSERLRAYLERHGAAAPAVAEWLRTAPALAKLEALIRRSIGPDGAILDSASSSLERARKRSLELRHDLRQRLTGLMGRMGEAMQGQYVAERDGRYVLPVRADAPFRVDGLVLGSSASGSTLYVEPRETHELGNRVQLAEAEARAEEARVLSELNAAVSEQLEAVRVAQKACIEADCLRALALYAKQADAIAFEPRAEPRLELKRMRHPLLIEDGAKVIANDLSLAQASGLILSGPNAGGKTVALECFGLAAWMVRSGLPIPAAPGSIVGWFDPVFTDIGDNQSLMHSLSTFSAHVTHVSACLEQAGVGTLVLVDELTSGTDPEEGSALACAIVEALVARGAAVCVTTHYERLKALAASHPRLSNAAVGFDRERLLPTFSIEHGIPGASSALLVARRYGIEPDIINRAEALLPHGLTDQRALERELDEQRARWQAAADEAEAERRTAADLRRELDKERRRALSEERGVLTRETQAVLDEVRQARVRLRQAEAKVKGLELGPGSVSETRRAVNEAAEFVAIGGKLRKAAAALDPAPVPSLARLAWDDLAPGARVTLNSLGASGHVVAKPRRDQVTVAVGSMKTTVSIDALSLLPGNAGAASPASAAGKSTNKKPRDRGAGSGSELAASRPEGGTPQRTSVNTIGLIGQRVEAALEQLDVAIDKLVQSGEHVAFVLHGHGTGALKNAVREHVRRHPNVVRAEPAERDDGGDALTLLWLG